MAAATPFGRKFAFNAAVYAALLSAVAGLSAWRGLTLDVPLVVGATVLGAVVAGALGAVIEARAPTSARPIVLAAGLGAIAYVALCAAVTVVAGAPLDPALLAIGAVVGALSHIARMQRAIDAARADDAGDDDADAR